MMRLVLFALTLFLSAGVLAEYVPYDSDSFVPDVRGTKTGYFHVEKDGDGRWWAIDPEGRGFCPFGISHCRIWQQGSDYQERNIRRLGSESAWLEETLARLKDWHFNFFDGGWWPQDGLRKGISHAVFPWMGQPFAFDPQRPERRLFMRGDGTVPGSCFPNVFLPEWKGFCREVARRQFAPQRSDPWVLGHYSDNELAWWGALDADDETGLYDAVRKLPDDHPGRKALERFTEGRRNLPVREIKREFLRLVAEKYFEGVTEAIREADPNHLYLGCRFARFNRVPDALWEVAGRYLDVISLNCYAWADLDRNQIFDDPVSRMPLSERLERIHRKTGRPLLLTEWSFAAVDSGVPCSFGDGQVFRTQQERARAAALYARTVLSLPYVIGYSFFMWADQPAGGVSAGFQENFNFGLVNRDGVAYREITSVLKRIQGEPGRWHRAEAPRARLVDRERMPQTDMEFVKDAVGERGDAPIDVKSSTGERALLFFGKDRQVGWMQPLVQFNAGESTSFCRSDRVVAVRKAEREMAGRQVMHVEFDCESLGCRHRTTLAVVPCGQGNGILVSLVKVENTGDRPFVISSFHFSLFPTFEAEPAFDWAIQPKRLWGEPRRLAWRDRQGSFRLGLRTYSFAMDHFARFWKSPEGHLHPDAFFRPERPVELQPHETWEPSAGRLYVCVSLSRDETRDQ